MKVYISCDMEGATGVVRWEQVSADKPEYAFGCAMQLHDLLAVANAAVEFGATEVLVNDSHARMINLDLRQFPEAVRLVSGAGKPLSMVEQVAGADVAFFVCYHAMAGTAEGVLDHTMSGDTFEVSVNGVVVGEMGFNAAVAGHFGVPVGLVAGDAAVCRETRALLGDQVAVCAVKQGLGRQAAITLPPEATAKLLREAVRDALQGGRRPVPYRVGTPCDVRLTVMNSAQGDQIDNLPGTRRESGRTFCFRAKDAAEGYRWFRAALALAGTVNR